jgi:hypothetical protein
MIKKPHDYNNDDYNDDNDDDYNTIIINPQVDCDSDSMDFVPGMASTSSSPSPSGDGVSHVGTLPAKWTYAKVTLFDNADVEEIRAGKRRLKLALSVKSAKDGKFKQFTASMNSPFRNLKRGLSSEDYADSHYQKIIQLYQDAKESTDAVTVSKFHITGDQVKGRTVKRLSALLIALPKDGQYLAAIVVGDDVVYFQLSGKDLTAKQRKQGAIGQAYISSGIVQSPDVEDLF